MYGWQSCTIHTGIKSNCNNIIQQLKTRKTIWKRKIYISNLIYIIKQTNQLEHCNTSMLIAPSPLQKRLLHFFRLPKWLKFKLMHSFVSQPAEKNWKTHGRKAAFFPHCRPRITKSRRRQCTQPHSSRLIVYTLRRLPVLYKHSIACARRGDGSGNVTRALGACYRNNHLCSHPAPILCISARAREREREIERKLVASNRATTGAWKSIWRTESGSIFLATRLITRGRKGAVAGMGDACPVLKSRQACVAQWTVWLWERSFWYFDRMWRGECWMYLHFFLLSRELVIEALRCTQCTINISRDDVRYCDCSIYWQHYFARLRLLLPLLFFFESCRIFNERLSTVSNRLIPGLNLDLCNFGKKC